MSHFLNITQKLQQFIKKYYTNELLKGVILFFAIGLLYLLLTLFIEYMLWLNPTARRVLFWLFIAVETALFVKFIIFPLTLLFNIRKGINFESASRIIGSHFPEVNDKLLNVLQLNQNSYQSDLLIASIEQKAAELRPVPFLSAIDFKSSISYLKYAAIPLVILLASYITGKIDWFSNSYERVVNYNTSYEQPAPFEFFIVNESLNAIENKDFNLIVKTVGSVSPDKVQIAYNGQTYFLQQNSIGEFQYRFKQLKEAISFRLSANDVVSKYYELNVVNVPTLVGFDMILNYPSHTKKKAELLKSTGSTTVPEGTKATWRVTTTSTDNVTMYYKDTLSFKPVNKTTFEASKRLFKDFNYTISTSNTKLKDYERLAFSINVVKDMYPELDIKVEKDTTDMQSLYFYGQASDDYGLQKLQLVYYKADEELNKQRLNVEVSRSNFSEFIAAFPNQINIEEGVAYQLYFELFDNDAINTFKSVKSQVFNYRKRTKDQEEAKQLKDQNETINNLNKTFENLKEQDKKLDELSKTQKEKNALNFNDKKKFESFLKRQKQQEQMMKNFNKKLQDNLEEFQKDIDKKDQFKEDLKERLKENEEQLKKDEKLLEELEKLKEKINKEEFSQKLDELAKQNKNKKRSMQQLLELTKRFYVTKKLEKVQRQLEDLSKEQQTLSEQTDDKNTKESQQKLNQKFMDLQKDIEQLKSENRKLRQPMDIERDKLTEESIKKDQKEATEQLANKKSPENTKAPNTNQNKQQARQKQQNAAKKMKQLSQMMKQAMMSGGSGGDKMQEDAEMLRQILDNLVLFSFDQEALMDQFNNMDINHNQYGKFIIKQSNLREHFEHVDDSLFALSLRNPKFSERINKQITEVYFNMDKALGQLAENQIYHGTSSQQYTVTAANTLANMLSNILDNMEMQMNMQPGQGGSCEMQLPDIIMSQQELNKKMEDALKKLENDQKQQEGSQGKEGNEDNDESKVKKGKEKEGQNGENGNGNNNDDQHPKGNGKSDGKDGKGKGNNDNNQNNNEGYGEGGNEELNGELYKIFQQQQQLRQVLQNKIGKNGNMGTAGDLIKKMEEVELDLINKGFTNQTLEKMMNLQHQLLKLENATFTQGEDDKRESKTNRKTFNSTSKSQIDTAKDYFNTLEILNRQTLPLQHRLKKKVQDYFKTTDD